MDKAKAALDAKDTADKMAKTYFNKKGKAALDAISTLDKMAKTYFNSTNSSKMQQPNKANITED